jgi:Domain of unknown function (DUF4277)
MVLAVQQIAPIAHLPLLLGVVRRLAVATVMDRRIPPPPAPARSTGCGVAALVLALLDGPHARSKVEPRLAARGLRLWLQPGLTRGSLHEARLGHSLAALFAANLQKVVSALALKALAGSASPPPGWPQDPTPLAL